MSAAAALVDGLPRTTLVVGKGGVGKTTCAAALALHASRRYGATLVLSTDPARALPTVLAHPVGAEPALVAYAPRLNAQILDAGALRGRFMERWGNVLREILDRGTYLDDSDIGPLVDTAMPGADEIFSALALAELLSQGSRPADRGSAPEHPEPATFSRILVDTAPTGHTLRLLNLPATFRALVRLLDAMQSKHRFMVRALTRGYRADAADAFLSEMETLVSALEDSLRDKKHCATVMVTNAQPLVVEETRRYLAALRDLQIHVAAVVWNGEDRAGEPLDEADQYAVPRLDRWPVGEEGLSLWLERLKQANRARPEAKSARTAEDAEDAEGRAQKFHSFANSAPPAVKVSAPPAVKVSPPPAVKVSAPSAVKTSARGSLQSLIRPLTIVAGKGGVGKTTVAATLALSATAKKRTLVVSTDPAPSLADALAQPVPDDDTAVKGVPALFARQMDASAAFARLREEYESRVDALFEGLIAKGVDLAHDRAVARDLLSLAPPGVDEVYALSLLSDALFQNNYECVIVDPAPTGHLLRLLEMPQLALEWTHQLMRLMLKYKEVAALGDTAREILAFSKSLRAVDALLRDRARTAVVLVALDEPVVRAETERLAAELRRLGVDISGVVLNRAADEVTAPLPVPDAAVHLEAPAVTPAPVGVESLRRWGASWIER